MSDETKPFRGRPVPIPAFVQAPTPDPRERGEAVVLSPSDVRVLIAETCDLREADVVRTVERAVLAKVAALRAPAPSEAVDEDERCEVCVERRATIHLEGAVNELCAECHIERLERVVNGPVGETRRLLASFIQRVGDNCRLDADGYCQGHFLERGDQCTVKLARELLAAHPAPARGVTVTEAMVERAMGVECGSTHHEHHPPDCRRCWQAKLTAALTPDAEGGA